MHTIEEKNLIAAYHDALERNNFRYVIVDVKIMKDRKRNFFNILPSGYECISRKKYRAVESEIWIETWESKKER